MVSLKIKIPLLSKYVTGMNTKPNFTEIRQEKKRKEGKQKCHLNTKNTPSNVEIKMVH